jgi:hypothetical protein
MRLEYEFLKANAMSSPHSTIVSLSVRVDEFSCKAEMKRVTRHFSFGFTLESFKFWSNRYFCL